MKHKLSLLLFENYFLNSEETQCWITIMEHKQVIR